MASFENSPESVFYVQGNTFTTTFKGTRTAEEVAFIFHPEDDEMARVNGTPAGRGACISGGRKGTIPPALLPDNVDEMQEGNNHVAKVLAAEDTSTSEVDIIKKTREYGKRSNLSPTTSLTWYVT